MWLAVSLVAAVIVAGHAAGLRRSGREAFAPIAILGGTALVGLGSLASGWIIFSGMKRLSPSPSPAASLATVAGFLTAAQQIGLTVAAMTVLMAASIMLIKGPPPEVTRPRNGPTSHRLFLWMAAAGLAFAILLMVVDAICTRTVMAAVRPGSAVDPAWASRNIAMMVLALLFGGFHVAAGAGVAALVGFFIMKREPVSRVLAATSYVLLLLLGMSALITSGSHVANLLELRGLADSHGTNTPTPQKTPGASGASQAPVRWSAAVMDYDDPPQALQQTRPVYPLEAFEKHVEGTVLVEILIGEDGRVVRTRIIESVPLLGAAALECVSSWRFKPAQKRGRPVATIARAPVTFRVGR